MSHAVAVVLPVHRPDPGHLAAQLASIAAQQGVAVRVVGVVADSTSGPLLARLAAEAGLALETVAPGGTLEAPRAVEAGLAAALAGPEAHFALADQDDIWHPQRLARGLAALAGSGAALAHSDARLIGPGGEVLAPSLFAYERRHPRPGLRGLLLRNAVTGMTATFPRELAALALPFPPQAGVHFYHDLWLALLAEATAGTVRLPEALVDYRQHGTNAMGAVDRRRPPRLAGRIGLPDPGWLRREAAGYALARYLAHAAAARLAEAGEDGRLPAGGARAGALAPYLAPRGGAGRLALDALVLAAGGHLRLARIAAGHATVALGRRVWALREALGAGQAAALAEFDARLYTMAPGLPPPAPAAATPSAPMAAEALIDRRAHARFTPVFTAPGPAVRVLVPTLNPTEVYAGVATALDIAIGLAAEGLEVRLVATDLPLYAPEASRHFVLARMTPAQAAAGAAGRIALVCGASGGEMAAHRGDRFLATAWWTARMAHDLIRGQGFAARRFHYLLQDDEAHFYPWGAEHAGAAATLALPCVPVFNSAPLRDHLAAQGHALAGPQALTFHPAVALAGFAGLRAERAGGPLRLAVYGRPRVPRNMFPLAVEALDLFLRDRPPGSVALLSVGERHAPVRFAGGHVLESLGKLAPADYPAFLRGVDVGLSLMLSPHPSHPPLEMAAAGVRVVTNRFPGRNLAALSPAIAEAAPTAPALAAALARAVEAAEAGPLPEAARQIDLSRLGAPLAAIIPALAAQMRAPDPAAPGP